MARYEHTAQGLAALGRNGDSTLLHVNPQEIAGLSALLGVEPTINPDTGMPEAFSFLSPIMGIINSVASMGVGASVADAAKDIGFDYIPDWLTGGLAGAATGAGLGALGGAITGDAGNGALAGAVSGGAMGGYGAMEAENLLGGTGIKTAENPSLMTDKSLPYAQMGDEVAKAQPPTAQFGDSFLSNLKSFGNENFIKEGGLKKAFNAYAPAIGMGAMGYSGIYGGLENADYAEEQERKLKELEEQRMAMAGLTYADMVPSVTISRRGFAEGGPIIGRSNEFGIPTLVKIPAHYVEEFQKAGGIQNILKAELGLAQGGYINTQPFDPDTAYPQSMIHKAKHYPGSMPIRNEVVDGYEDGGFVEGDGDGMSDDVEATINGEEEVRVADGEVIIPKVIVDMFGVEALDTMLKRVRIAAYGTDKQVEQDAGKEVVMDMLDL